MVLLKIHVLVFMSGQSRLLIGLTVMHIHIRDGRRHINYKIRVCINASQKLSIKLYFEYIAGKDLHAYQQHFPCTINSICQLDNV